MKKIILVTAIWCAVGNRAAAQNYITEKDPRHGNRLYKGFVTDSLLKADTACRWFPEAQKVYTPRPEVVAAVAAHKTDAHFLIFMGTWCEDSHFVVPRFYKILDAAGFDKSRLALIAVDRDKKDLAGLAQVFKVTNVPAIIVFKNGKETGRVVEYGTSGRFDEELAAILKAK